MNTPVCIVEKYLLRRLASWLVMGLDGHINKSMIKGYEVQSENYNLYRKPIMKNYIQLVATLWGNIF